MPYDGQNTPDAPMPVSMLPRATALTKNDLLYLVQPGNTRGGERPSVCRQQLFMRKNNVMFLKRLEKTYERQTA